MESIDFWRGLGANLRVVSSSRIRRGGAKLLVSIQVVIRLITKLTGVRLGQGSTTVSALIIHLCVCLVCYLSLAKRLSNIRVKYKTTGVRSDHRIVRILA